jgi:hypothetical protein
MLGSAHGAILMTARARGFTDDEGWIAYDNDLLLLAA